MQCRKEGYEAYLLFVIQMKGIRLFQPNWDTHRKFGETLREAAAQGVRILAYDCRVTENSMEIETPVSIDLEETYAE